VIEHYAGKGACALGQVREYCGYIGRWCSFGEGAYGMTFAIIWAQKVHVIWGVAASFTAHEKEWLD
jgi:hypothetical protein